MCLTIISMALLSLKPKTDWNTSVKLAVQQCQIKNLILGTLKANLRRIKCPNPKLNASTVFEKINVLLTLY